MFGVLLDTKVMLKLVILVHNALEQVRSGLLMMPQSGGKVLLQDLLLVVIAATKVNIRMLLPQLNVLLQQVQVV